MFEIGVYLCLWPMSGGTGRVSSVHWPCVAGGSCVGQLSPDLCLLLGLRAVPCFPGGWAPIMVKERAVGVGSLGGLG